MKIKIEKMGFAGSGIGHLDDGRVIFVKKTVPGDIVEVDTIDEKKDFAFGKVKKVIEVSAKRIEAPCQYFYDCGSCSHQNTSIENQLKTKENLVQESLIRKRIEFKPAPIIAASQCEYYYRNSIRFSLVLDTKNQIHIAQHRYPDEREFLPIDSCMLQSEVSNTIAKKLCDYINNNIKHKSSFWQLRIREGKETSEIMVEIMTSNKHLPHRDEIINILKKVSGITSIYHTVSESSSLLDLKRQLIFGEPFIHEKIGDYTYQISPESFFQTNSKGAATLYDKIKEYADVNTGDEIADLYCGTGSIGIYLSNLAKKVTGIEVERSAITDAKENAKLNNVENSEFICADVLKCLKSKTLSLDNKIIIVDPPREGLDKELISLIAKSKFKRLIYVSCHPATFARDLQLFMEKGITAKKVQPIDMFPQTHHIELVSLLERQIHSL